MTKREQALNNERLDWMERATNAEAALRDLMQYLRQPKFHGDGDYVYISTDLYPKLQVIMNGITEPVTRWSENV